MTQIHPTLDHLIWIDLEMTGLDPDRDHIIEIAAVITDAHLEIIAESPVFAIFQPDEVLDAMDNWNQSTHARTGLIDRVKVSNQTEGIAETAMLSFLKTHVADKTSPMCGNSICQDRRFLARHMPKLEDFFHYRNLDVSTIKELARRWHPVVAKSFQKRSAHTALADIYESIDELKHYRTHLFVESSS